MPLVKKTRAPGMAFYVVALVTAMFAGLGVERALKGAGRRVMTLALIIGGVVAPLGGTRGFGHIAAAPAAREGAPPRAPPGALLWGGGTSGVALSPPAAALCPGQGRPPP